MKKIICFFLSVFIIFAWGCGTAKKDSGIVMKNNVTNGDGSSRNELAKDDAIKSNENIEDNQKIIFNGEIFIVIEDIAKFSSSLNNKVHELKGYVQNEEIMEERSIISVRIPSSRFNEFLSYAESIGKLKNKRISSDNITEAYVDNDSRLRNLKAQESQVLDILKKANSVEEVLKVQNELFRIRGEIEALEGRKKLWDSQIEYATVLINAEKIKTIPNNSVSVISGSEFIKSIKRGFTNSTLYIVLVIQKLLIFLIANIIWILILSVIIIIIYRKGIFKRNK